MPRVCSKSTNIKFYMGSLSFVYQRFNAKQLSQGYNHLLQCLFSFSDMLNSRQISFVHLLIHSHIHSSRAIVLFRMVFVCCHVIVFWTVLGELGKMGILEVTEQVFREWYWCTHVFERVFKCVHELISGNFTRLG